ncbi:MAG TPA: DNA primase [Candidatus Baltobacteraceae bacterium]|jgi:DNA primase|nr:DNA primase [Candidatus Baltobacteraceae bacterium]
MRFDQSAIREIHTRVDIAGFIGSYVALHKRGNDLVGLCPFHSERTPSFHVHPDKGFFKCFGCGEGGDVITFISKLENLAFPDAVRLLAQRAGIELAPETPQTARVRSEREAIYQANIVATAFFERMLRDPRGAGARAYCERRGLGAGALEKFHLGYAPDEWSALAGELQHHGVDSETAAKAGLLKRGERGFYDFYRDRLMVPTYSTTGEVIAFGGRALGDAEPKYLNTSTTPVYTKGRHLFALNLARRAASHDGTLIVVEGYLDCIALHQAGFENAVASLGTAFTEEQARELRKYAGGIFLCFDGDAAGNAAAAKAIDIAVNVIEHAGSSVRIVMLPAGSDPDAFVREHGAAAFRALMDAAKPAIEYRLEREAERLQRGFESPADVAKQAEALIRRMTPQLEWDRWRVWIAKRLKVNENDLRNSRFLANPSNFAPRSPGVAPASRHIAVNSAPSSFEREVLAIVLEEPALLRDFADRIPLERFRNQTYARIYARLGEHASRLEQASDVFALFSDDNESMGVLTSLGQRDRSSTVRYEDPAQRRAHLDRVVERLQLDEEQKRYQELSRRIDDTIMAGQSVSADLRNEFDTLVAKLKK